ncbi:MAG: hypothetical protein ABEJ66_02995, partial [Candidatus Nanohaloarchaea archaeon]
EQDTGFLNSLLDRVRPWLENYLERSELAMKLGMLLELDPSSIIDLQRRGTRQALEDYYEQNLRLAMEAARDMAAELDGKVVV